MSAIVAAMPAGDIAPSEAAKIAKVIDGYVKAFQIAELDERMARVEQLSDAKLMRIAMGRYMAETNTPVSRPLTVPSR